jgi:hypothetical protein
MDRVPEAVAVARCGQLAEIFPYSIRADQPSA